MMKKIFRILLIAAILIIPTIKVSADTPYTTWALGPGGDIYMTQDAYSPYAEIDLPINGAEDLFIAPDGSMYIADTGNGQIVRLKNMLITDTFGKGILASPSGIFVDDQGTMYVADSKKNEIFIFDNTGNLLKEIGRPTEPLFGKNREFLPRKIAVDERQNLYIISEGSVNGIVQMNTNGNFIGYFGANTSTMSFKMILQRLFLTKEQLDQFVKNEAASPSNIAIDNQSMVYTITAGTSSRKAIRKFTIAGKNIFPDAISSLTLRDIDISEDGLVLAVDDVGAIFEYDSNGALLFAFLAKDAGDQRLGSLRQPTGIDRYEDFIYVLDKDKNAIVIYQTTAFARMVHDGVRLYMDGYYAEAKPYFEQVLDYNGSFILSYQAIADAYYKERDYDTALATYRYAEDHDGYSQAFWELRNGVLQRYLSQAILWLVGLSIVQTVSSRLDRRYRWLDPARKWLHDLTRHKLIDDFVFIFYFIRHPLDGFYYIKKNLRGSLLFAFLIYLWVVVVRVVSLYVTGFIFSPYTSYTQIHVENEIIYTLGMIALWNAANYLISTISDGEGRVRDVVIGTAYSLFPYVLFALPIALISNVLTLNEIFIYSFSLNIMWFWMGLMLFIMVKEIHNYSFRETVRNVLLTLFTIGLFVLTGYILYVLFGQLFDFISAILQEVRLRG
jgi:tetratricopeptide (TPR) repeat protein